ncbi:hypothetical protein ScPMuIL_018442 [Solemya velum]
MSFPIIVVCSVILARINADANLEVKEVYFEKENLQDCPQRAVAADIFEFRRDFYNGTAWDERRTVVNCRCSDEETIPVGEQYVISQSQKHQEVLCSSVFVIPDCEGDGLARIIHYDAPEFDNRNYEEILCICPLHREMVPGQRATTLAHKGYQNHYYKCKQGRMPWARSARRR